MPQARTAGGRPGAAKLDQRSCCCPTTPSWSCSRPSPMLMIRLHDSACSYVPSRVLSARNHPRPKPRELSASKLRDNDADDTNNRVGLWSCERLPKMDACFVAAM